LVWQWAVDLIAGGADEKRSFGAARVNMEITNNIGVTPTASGAILAFPGNGTHSITAEAHQLCFFEFVGRLKSMTPPLRK